METVVLCRLTSAQSFVFCSCCFLSRIIVTDSTIRREQIHRIVIDMKLKQEYKSVISAVNFCCESSKFLFILFSIDAQGFLFPGDMYTLLKSVKRLVCNFEQVV
jgi:hypothetical protein